MFEFIKKEDILAAASRIEPYVHRTPVLTSSFFNSLADALLFFKCENFQKAGAFKMRGATNALLKLNKDEQEKGVATHSSGNHAAALSLAAMNLGIRANIVMPSNSSRVKIAAVESYKGMIRFCEPTLEARETTLNQVVSETGAIEIHPYNNQSIIEGQASCAKELIEDTEQLDYIIAPVGGGGLLSGTALATHYFSPGTKVIAAEPSGADDAYRSFQQGKIVPSVHPETIADGLRTSLGTLTFPVIQRHVSDILLVPDDEIVECMRLVWERMKIVIEPSAAVTIAALLHNKQRFRGKRVGLILSGGNVDLSNLPY